MPAIKRLGMGMAVLMIGLATLSTSGWAEKAYVVDSIKVAVRSGPGSDQKYVGLVESGQTVEVLQPGDEWSQVRLENGMEGFVMSRYLTATPTARFRLEELRQKNQNLSQQAAGLMEESSRLKAENEKLIAELAAAEQKLGALRSEFETFKQQATDVTGLQSRMEALQVDLDHKKQQIAELESKPALLWDSENFYWFLAGAGVLLLGFLIGYAAKRQRRWSSLA